MDEQMRVTCKCGRWRSDGQYWTVRWGDKEYPDEYIRAGGSDKFYCYDCHCELSFDTEGNPVAKVMVPMAALTILAGWMRDFSDPRGFCPPRSIVPHCRGEYDCAKCWADAALKAAGGEHDATNPQWVFANKRADHSNEEHEEATNMTRTQVMMKQTEDGGYNVIFQDETGEREVLYTFEDTPRPGLSACEAARVVALEVASHLPGCVVWVDDPAAVERASANARYAASMAYTSPEGEDDGDDNV